MNIMGLFSTKYII